MRDPALALYAFCRLADDAVDEGDDLGQLEQLDGRAAMAAFMAMQARADLDP